MNDLDRRRFLQSTSLSLLLGSGLLRSAMGDEPVVNPPFAAKPTFDPTGLFLTWQRDPTTTMTIQWIGTEQEGATRPVWYAKQDTIGWKTQPHVVKPFPQTDLRIFRTELTGLEHSMKNELILAERHQRSNAQARGELNKLIDQLGIKPALLDVMTP